jgi:DNA topoisomerase-1
MADKLVIVESPAKAKTIQKYLGRGFQVEASMGHVRDLPKRDLGIDLDAGFAPVYEVSPGKERVIANLKKSARQVEAIYLATDPDREGEAIAWHITQAVGIPRATPVYRVVFSEITRNAVLQAIAAPRQIDRNLVDAQQARRVLDRLVGYKLSPLLWDKVRRGLSAGRVQSVAVRLVVDREREIEAFVPQEYWTIEADLSKRRAREARDAFRAVLIERRGEKLDKFAINNAEQAHGIVADLDGADYRVRKIVRKDKRRTAAPPFTTSTLQQEAGRKLGFSAKRTMIVAQQLYEGIDIGGDEGTVGLITYMRTDSFNVARDAQEEARVVIRERFGDAYLPEKPPVYRQKSKGAQEAHEAIRPTSSQRAPEALRARLSNEQFRLYDLIWKRFVASQMAPAIFDSTSVDIGAGRTLAAAGADPYTFRATGSVLKFPGFLAVYNVSLDEGEEDEDREARLPLLAEGEPLDLQQLLPVQHFTEPPPRYTEASLVKELERLGIGRPSTYAPTISTVIEREYIELTEKKLLPTTLGRVVTDLLVEHFPSIVDYGFTSEIEAQLDNIADGEKQWVPVIRDFYGPFEQRLTEAQRSMRNVKREELPTDLLCPRCQQGPLLIKFGKNGEFLACARYSREGGEDSCDFTSDFHRDGEGRIVIDAAATPEMSDVACHECGKPMVIKKSRFGPFLGCSGYPECKATRRIGKDGKPAALPKPLGVPCPKCSDGELVERPGRFGRPFIGCNRYPKCDYIANERGEEQPASARPGRAGGAAKPASGAAKPVSGAAKKANGKAKKAPSTPKRASGGAVRSTRAAAPAAKNGRATAKPPAAEGRAPTAAPRPAARKRAS